MELWPLTEGRVPQWEDNEERPRIFMLGQIKESLLLSWWSWVFVVETNWNFRTEMT